MQHLSTYPIKRAVFMLCTLVLIADLQAANDGAPDSEEAVVLTGWLHVEDHTMADVVLEVEVNGTLRTAQVSESGRFTVTLPANTEATLRFEKPGHLTKEVAVDTRHAREGLKGQRSRHVKFAVIMQLERHMGNWTYNGPVGGLSFEEGGGCLAVQHNNVLVPSDRNRPMVF